MRTPVAMISYATFVIAMTAGSANAQTGSTDLPRVAGDTPALTAPQNTNLKALPPPAGYTHRITPTDRNDDPTETETAKTMPQPLTDKGASANGTASGQEQPAVHSP